MIKFIQRPPPPIGTLPLSADRLRQRRTLDDSALQRTIMSNPGTDSVIHGKIVMALAVPRWRLHAVGMGVGGGCVVKNQSKIVNR